MIHLGECQIKSYLDANNTCIGYQASSAIIVIVGALGTAGDANKFRTGKSTHTATYIAGIYKEGIQPMGKAGEAVL